jgi:hypothetical protein
MRDAPQGLSGRIFRLIRMGTKGSPWLADGAFAVERIIATCAGRFDDWQTSNRTTQHRVAIANPSAFI